MDPNDHNNYGNEQRDITGTTVNTHTKLPSPKPNFSLSKHTLWQESSYSSNDYALQQRQRGDFDFNATETDPKTGYAIGGYSSWQTFTTRAALDSYTPKVGDSIKIIKTKTVYSY